MPKCAINRFKAGGSCAGSGGGGADKAPQNVGLAAMMAARESQDRAWASPLAATATTGAKAQLVLLAKPAGSKQKDMDIILQGDCQWD